MSSCKLDHPPEDVRKKLETQKPFLPNELYQQSAAFLAVEPTQPELNELFHLLKKYDLASAEEQQERNEKLEKLVS
ncbi:group-specific protein [Alkalihalobacillus oceani]|uniref:Group-specific protein n=1 Tax=Halalkalibacter oceani TaxID=1653776 RepID=A0A9X2IMN0_9BACI|nr:group-specific protein [Halalkalibacter oceani]MCM3712926.1 group-specific protein [Halalkalibacter oceani]